MIISNTKPYNVSINIKTTDKLNKENSQSQNKLNLNTTPIANLSKLHFSGVLVDFEKTKFQKFIKNLTLQYTTKDINKIEGELEEDGSKYTCLSNGEIFKYISAIENDNEKIHTIHSAFNYVEEILKNPAKIFYDTTNKSEQIVDNISESADMISSIKTDFAESASLITNPELRAAEIFEFSKSKDDNIKKGAILAIKSIEDQNSKDKIILEMANNPENFEHYNWLSPCYINFTLEQASNKLKSKLFLEAREKYPEEGYRLGNDIVKSLTKDPIEMNNFISKFIELSKNDNSELKTIIDIIKKIQDPAIQGTLLLKLAKKRSEIEPTDPFNIRVGSILEILFNCEDVHKVDIIPLLQGKESYFKRVDPKTFIKKALPKDLELRRILTANVMQKDSEAGKILQNLEN